LKKGEMIDEALTFQDWLEYRESSSINNPIMSASPVEDNKPTDTSLITSLRSKLGLK
jgi:hypothetical protein